MTTDNPVTRSIITPESPSRVNSNKISFDFKSKVKVKGVFFLLLCTGLDDRIIFFSWSEIRQAEIAKLMVNFRNSHWTAVTREGKGCAQDKEQSSALTKLL